MQYVLYIIYYIHIIFTAWLMVYTFENTNALEHIFICVLLGLIQSTKGNC